MFMQNVLIPHRRAPLCGGHLGPGKKGAKIPGGRLDRLKPSDGSWHPGEAEGVLGKAEDIMTLS